MAFNLADMMSKASKKNAGITHESKTLNLADIVPNPTNREVYNTEDIEELAESIEVSGLMHNLVVTPIEGGKYMLLSGHRRWMALRMLAERDASFLLADCRVEHEEDELKRQLILICTNATARTLSDAEKVKQAEKTTEICRRLKEEGKLDGRIRDIVANMLNESQSKLAKYSAISKNLRNEELREAFDSGKMGVSAAYEASKLTDEKQEGLAKQVNSGETITLQKVKDASKAERQEAALDSNTQGKIERNHEGLPMKEIELDLKKKFKARVTILIVKKEGKFYVSSDGFCKTSGWGGCPSALHGKPYGSEQESIEEEIKKIARKSNEWRRILWESGYLIVGDPEEKREAVFDSNTEGNAEFAFIGEAEHQRLLGKIEREGYESLSPCEKCTMGTMCKKCCKTCAADCNARQPCEAIEKQKRDKTLLMLAMKKVRAELKTKMEHYDSLRKIEDENIEEARVICDCYAMLIVEIDLKIKRLEE